MHREETLVLKIVKIAAVLVFFIAILSGGLNSAAGSSQTSLGKSNLAQPLSAGSTSVTKYTSSLLGKAVVNNVGQEPPSAPFWDAGYMDGPKCYRD